mmetsp:Transcript_105705/g.295980  ORF Transcript_105705/g.295980 Transcript_105705/m.295980 type:complete len:222 (+) Transcript_105705:215-880(+)
MGPQQEAVELQEGHLPVPPRAEGCGLRRPQPPRRGGAPTRGLGAAVRAQGPERRRARPARRRGAAGGGGDVEATPGLVHGGAAARRGGGMRRRGAEGRGGGAEGALCGACRRGGGEPQVHKCLLVDHGLHGRRRWPPQPWRRRLRHPAAVAAEVPQRGTGDDMALEAAPHGGPRVHARGLREGRRGRRAEAPDAGARAAPRSGAGAGATMVAERGEAPASS